MGKCVRIRGGSKRNPSPSTTGEAAAAACLTLRSGRRVPVAASSSCSPPPGRCRRQRRCGAKRACGSPGRRKCASEARPPHAAAALAGADDLNGGGDRPAKEDEELLPSSSPLASPAARDVDGDRGDSAPTTTPLSGDEVKSNHEHGRSNGGVVPAGQPSPLLQAEMEAFFAAAELAERRRFAESYNYDVALDRPLEGRFEWAPVST